MHPRTEISTTQREAIDTLIRDIQVLPRNVGQLVELCEQGIRKHRKEARQVRDEPERHAELMDRARYLRETATAIGLFPSYTRKALNEYSQ
ncbi:MAG TPA: hypothetical protein VJB66_02155 [Candidatus Nanoarchaeia archaeon]|nr:hypothetical protein [Candidatus Nanoarchaeia archaeon]